MNRCDGLFQTAKIVAFYKNTYTLARGGFWLAVCIDRYRLYSELAASVKNNLCVDTNFTQSIFFIEHGVSSAETLFFLYFRSFVTVYTQKQSLRGLVIR